MKNQEEEAWMRDATCARVDLPWTADSSRVNPVLVLLMQEACAQCPVLEQCGDYVAAHQISGGWWAGKDRNSTSPDMDPAHSDSVARGSSEERESVTFGDVIADEVEVPAFLAHYLTRSYPGGDAA